MVDPKGSGTNKHRYAVASQDREVRAKMRAIAGVPLVYINRSVMILEPMAGATEAVREREERGKVRAGLMGGRGAKGVGVKRKREDEDDVTGVQDAKSKVQDEQVAKKKRARGPKGPNPLSVKKVKKDSGGKTAVSEVGDGEAVLSKAEKKDPQEGEKAIDASLAVESVGADGITEGPRKRKRKRKPRESMEGAVIPAVGTEVGEE